MWPGEEQATDRRAGGEGAEVQSAPDGISVDDLHRVRTAVPGLSALDAFARDEVVCWSAVVRRISEEEVSGLVEEGDELRELVEEALPGSGEETRALFDVVPSQERLDHDVLPPPVRRERGHVTRRDPGVAHRQEDVTRDALWKYPITNARFGGPASGDAAPEGSTAR